MRINCKHYKKASSFPLVDLLMKPNTLQKQSPFTSSENKASKGLPLIDRLKDCKVMGMWASACALFGSAARSNSIGLRWQTFHVKCFFECLANAFRWHEINQAWDILIRIDKSVHCILDDNVLNVLLNLVSIKKQVRSADQEKLSALNASLPSGNFIANIDEIFREGSKVAHSTSKAVGTGPELPFYLQVFDEMTKRGFQLDQYGARGYIVGTARSGLWVLAADIMQQCTGLLFNPPKISCHDGSSSERAYRPDYQASEIELAEVIQVSKNRHLLQNILHQNFPKQIKAHSLPACILTAAAKIQTDWQKGLDFLACNKGTTVDASLINVAVALAFHGSSSPSVVQSVLDFYINLSLNAPQSDDIRILPMIVLSKGLTKAYEMVIQCHARNGDWQSALKHFHASQKYNVPCSTDMHGSVLRSLNKSDRHIDIINSFLLVKDSDNGATGKKSILKTISFINAFTSFRRKKR